MCVCVIQNTSRDMLGQMDDWKPTDSLSVQARVLCSACHSCPSLAWRARGRVCQVSYVVLEALSLCDLP